MERLNIETKYINSGTKVMKITGFSEAELSELNSMDYRDMIDKVLDMLDSRNNGIGTAWHNGYGVYQMWISNGAVMVEIGTSCD